MASAEKALSKRKRNRNGRPNRKISAGNQISSDRKKGNYI